VGGLAEAAVGYRSTLETRLRGDDFRDTWRAIENTR
jgi:hypothetical protein